MEALEFDLKAFDELEAKIQSLFDRFGQLRRERDDLAGKCASFEKQIVLKDNEIEQLKACLREAEERGIKPETEKLIRKKLQNILRKLDSFQT
ncbi:cell division protein ZapB [bacterium]|nr:cell division protein ZapB [FCB group bacterium]MBL7192041.1 cell division protein ZapB [bacterium]